MATGYNCPQTFVKAFDNDGNPAPGAKLYAFLAGSTIPKKLYYDYALTQPCPHPLVADSDGNFAQYFLENGAYKLSLFDQDDNQLRPPEEPIWGAGGSGSGAGDTYKVKVNADDATPGFLEEKLDDSLDIQFAPNADNSKLENTIYQLTGLGAKLNVQPGTTFNFGAGPFPFASAGGRGICFGRHFVAGVEVDTWCAQGNDGKLYWTPNSDVARWKVVTEDDRLYADYPSARAHYGWSCIQFVYVGGTHNCYCWVIGSGDVARTMYYIEHKPASYNADGTFASGAVSTFVYGTSSSGNGPYSPIDIMQVDETGGIFVAGDDPTVGYTTDLATMSNALVAGANIGGMGYDGEDTVFVIERDTGKIWKSTLLGVPGSFSLYTSFFIDDVAAAHFPTTGVPSPQWGSMFCMYGQWLSINFHYGPGGIGFIYSDDGIYWYTSRDEAVPFYDANNDGLRWFATNATSNSASPIYQLIVSAIPAHRRMSLEKGAVVDGPLIMRKLVNAQLLGTDHRGRLVEAIDPPSSTATEIKLLGFDSAGALCVWTWHIGTAPPGSTPVSGDLAFSVVPE